MIHSIGLCNTFISQFPPTQPPEMLAAVRPQGHPKTRLYWPTPGYSGTNHLWEPSLEKQQHGCFRVSPPNPPTKKKTGACGMCVFFMFFCVGIFLCIYIYNEIFMLFAHRLWEKKHARELTCPPFFYDVSFPPPPKKGSQGGKGVCAVRCDRSPGGFSTPELQNPLLPSWPWLPLGSHLRAWDLSHWAQTHRGGKMGKIHPTSPWDPGI